MSRISTFKKRLLSRDPLCGTFLKTPHYVMIEIFAQSNFDFICLDGEHAPFDRAAMDQCLAVARALDFPVLVRVGDSSPREILWAMDCGAVGIVVPHVKTVEMAKDIAKSARFGNGGRGFAGSTRWASYATRPMSDLMQQSLNETVVIAQIEEPEAVSCAQAIGDVDGIDALFAGPADLSVGMGFDHQDAPELKQALQDIGQASKAAAVGYASFIGNEEMAQHWAETYGVHMFFVSSEHAFIRNAANKIAATIQTINIE